MYKFNHLNLYYDLLEININPLLDIYYNKPELIKFGCYDESYSILADSKFLTLLYENKITFCHYCIYINDYNYN